MRWHFEEGAGWRPGQTKGNEHDEARFARARCRRYRGHAIDAGRVDAFRLFISADAWGSFSQSAAYKSWKQACQDAGVPFFNPYKLRHSHATALRAQGMDLADVQELMGHNRRRRRGGTRWWRRKSRGCGRPAASGMAPDGFADDPYCEDLQDRH